MVRPHDIHSTPFLSLTATDIAPAWRTRFDAWYDDDHVPALLAHEMVRGASRFACVDGQPELLAIYSLERPDISSSPELQRLGGWGEFGPYLASVTSRRYERRWSTRDADTTLAGRADFLRLSWYHPKPQIDGDEFDRWLVNERLPEAVRAPNVLSAASFRCLNGEPIGLVLSELTGPQPPADSEVGHRVDDLKSFWTRTYRRTLTLT